MEIVMSSLKAFCTYLVLLAFFFTNVNAQIKVLSPDGGERFTSGDVIPVLWTGIPLTIPVDIEFSTDEGTTWSEITQGAIGGRYLWSVPEIDESDRCLIRLTTQASDDLNQKFIRSFQGHNGVANSVEISPDNEHIVTAGSDGVLIFWNMSTGEQLWKQKGHTQPIILTRFNFDGTLIATGSIDGTAIIWSATTGNPRHILYGQGGMIWPVGFSPDGTILATGNDNGTITLWSVEEGVALETFSPHREAVRYLEYTPDGSKIIASSTDRGASIIDAFTGQIVRSIVHTNDPNLRGRHVITNGVQLTHDGTVAVTCGYDGWVRFWNAQNGSFITEKKYHNGEEASEVRISPNGLWMTSVGYDGTTKIVNPHNGEILADIDPDMEGMIRSSFSPDNRYLALSHFDGKATLWELSVPMTDVSDGLWMIDYCVLELGVEEESLRSPSDDHINLKARQQKQLH